MKNPAPLIFLLFLFLVLVYILYDSGEVETYYPKKEVKLCTEDATQYCKVGNCSGLFTCKNGRWTPCKWERICDPGSILSCIEDGCAKGYKTCNECGTGYGPCSGSN